MLHVVNVHWMCVVDSFLRLHALQEHTPSPAVKLQVTACAQAVHPLCVLLYWQASFHNRQRRE